MLSEHMRRVAAATMILALGGLLVLSGCGPKQYKDYSDFMKKPRPIVSGKPYVIEPPDVIEVIAPSAPELARIGVTVRPDGFVTLPLLGDVFAAGKTPTQLASEIEEAVLKFYTDVSVQVTVTGFNSKRYYMAGETAQGPKPFTGKDTVLDAVLGSGVPFTARPSRVVVLRPNEDGELIRRMTISVKDMYEKGDLKYNAVLEEGDIVFVPVNPLAAVGRVIQNLLQPVNPLITAASTPRQAATAAVVP